MIEHDARLGWHPATEGNERVDRGSIYIEFGHHVHHLAGRDEGRGDAVEKICATPRPARTESIIERPSETITLALGEISI